jgi:tetratricopeptide (TPR) repeat protein
MEWLFHPYVGYALGAVVLVVAYQVLAPRLRVRIPGSSITLDDVFGKLLGPRYAEAKLDKTVAGHKKHGDFLLGGKLYEDANQPQKAADLYLEGQEFNAAAVVFERMGKLERAAELYLQAGDYKKAAQLFVDVGKPGKAATLFLEKGNSLEAARLFGQAQDWGRAGELYAKSGYPLRAAEAYEKKGEFARAAECYEKHFMENVTYATTYSATAATAEHKSALLAGRLYEKAGDPARAVQIFSRGGYFKEAGSASMKLGQYAKAAELFMRAEDQASAADAYDQAGDKVQAANLRGEVALKQDRVPEAAAFFKDGADYLRAAELFESVGMLAEAAASYEAGDSFSAAGSVYIRAGLKERAAASYERGGDFETAAKLYEEAGNRGKAAELYGRAGQTFKSGETAAAAGERDKAIALLQRVPPNDENYRAATELLARLFIEARMPGLALERVQKVLAGQPVSAATLDLYYWLAAAHEASGERREALVLYKKIQAEDLHFRDVGKRVTLLESGAVAQQPPRPPSVVAPASALTGGPPLGQPPAPIHAPAPATPPASAPQPAPPVGRSPTPTATPAVTPSKGARFHKKEELGRGRLGAVFRAEDQMDGRSVALRVLSPAMLKPELAAPLVADLKAAAQLSHPNVVKVLGLVDLSGERCIVTEFVAGRNFGEALAGGHKMAFKQVHSLARILAQALSAIHGKSLVHGSIQPSNIMVAAGVVKLADLGLGRLAQAVPAPQDYRGPEGKLDVHGDLYAMAAVLYHLLTGVHPKSQAQGAGLPLPSSLAPGVPESFDKLLVRCLHPRQELRLASADAVLQELKGMVHIG